ncbi:AI-2E family transporter [Paracoccus saliphilus]|uniref:AI-2E family transporter n=1 Tax=Paracoccus saliphilus TaxID=405559 RepID=A0AA45W2D5_9RHOB|nr:AI-2E family transporter [Paracoccus saliphilus]WCR01969.1 AI-2E family transporter [Paracoccus saliphilus]SIS65863.1 Predicted PurR-regulated permease PerM [Paracoccus saliphilus]
MSVPVRKQVMWWGVAALVLFVAMWLLGQAVLPFLLGAGIAYMLDPIADRLERMGLSRTMAVVVITAGAVFMLAAVILLLVPTLLRQAAALIETAPEMMDKARGFVYIHFPELVPEGGTIGSALSDLGQAMGEQLGKFAGTLLGSVRGVFGVVALFVIVPVVTFYLLLDWDRMVERIDALLPREHAVTVRRLATEVDGALSGFLRGQGLVILILGTWYSLALALVGLPFGFFIGIMAAVLSFIPYVGVLIGGATAIGVALFSFWGDPLWIGAVVVIFAIGQVVEGNYLQPKIVGGHVGLHPVWLLLALSVFGALFGFVGLVLAVPLAAALGVLTRFLIERYLESPLYTGKTAPPEPAPPVLVELAPRGTLVTELHKAYRREEAENNEKIAEADAGGPVQHDVPNRQG